MGLDQRIKDKIDSFSSMTKEFLKDIDFKDVQPKTFKFSHLGSQSFQITIDKDEVSLKAENQEQFAKTNDSIDEIEKAIDKAAPYMLQSCAEQILGVSRLELDFDQQAQLEDNIANICEKYGFDAPSHFHHDIDDKEMDVGDFEQDLGQSR